MARDNVNHFMTLALIEAEKAFEEDEVPVGAIIVKDGEVIARSHNSKERDTSPLAHAEINCLKQASEILHRWRLSDCEMYVTLEPCLMCMGAIIEARIKSLYIGVLDPRNGMAISNLNVLALSQLPHHPYIVYGVKEKECQEIIVTYFKGKR